MVWWVRREGRKEIVGCFVDVEVVCVWLLVAQRHCSRDMSPG